jgi:5-methylcytosine-specific restriction endonuclease McrA
MTIDHLVPKSMYTSGTWDIHNMTMLCHSCNSKKGVNYLPGIVQPTLVPDHIHKWATGGGGDFKGR